MGLSAVDMYLVAYNATACLLWTGVLSMSLMALLSSSSEVVGEDNSLLMSVWDRFKSIYPYPGLESTLIYAQSIAILEIIHAATGFVRSPVMVTFMQVSSRIFALYAVTASTIAQDQSGSGLMILSWSIVEVVRYLFYVFALITGDATKKTPYVLFWLRYSLFAILYPSGITGELTVFLNATKEESWSEGMKILYGYLLPFIYLFGSPFMIFNMAGNRAKAFKKRFARPPPPPLGIVFPLDEKNQRGSTPVNKAILAAALGAANPELEAKVNKAKGWRFGYVKFLSQMLQEQCQSPEVALKVAEAGLNKAYDIFEFVYPDGKSVSFKEAMAKKGTEKFFHTGYFKGEGEKPKERKLEVPYKGKILSGQPLKDQIQKWVDYGTIEPSCGDAMKACVDNQEKWLDLSDRYFVLLGAGSAMGPLLVLMALGANVIAVDLDRPQIWKRLIGIAKNSSGSITFPLRKEQSSYGNDMDALYAEAGCNLFTHTPMIRDWLLDLYPGKSFTVGSYAYLDGALHVQVSLAMDAISKDLSEKRKGTSLAYLCTPTDLHLIPKEVHEASLAYYKEYSKDIFCMMMNLLSNGKFLRKNAKDPVKTKDGKETFYYVNGISVAQGPNYALAKRMQHWRAIIARSKGCIVSSNIAPSTSTVSVVSNRTFGWAYEGMPYFRPYEISAPETSNAVMSAMLFYDLNDPKSSGNPNVKLANPNQLFSYGSFHGGLWRCAYMIDSIGEASVLIYFTRVAKPYLLGTAVVLSAIGAKVFLS